VFVAERLKGKRAAPPPAEGEAKHELRTAGDVFRFPEKQLWRNTVYPAAEGDNWFVSGSAAYWRILRGLPADPGKAASYSSDQLAEVSCRLSYTASREEPVAPAQAARRYDRYADYVFARGRGTFLLHQLRLTLGNETFGRFMDDLHVRFREKPVRTADIRAAAEKAAGRELGAFFRQWLERSDTPVLKISASSTEKSGSWQVKLVVRQDGTPYSFVSTVATKAKDRVIWDVVRLTGPVDTLRLEFPDRPLTVTLNAGNDVPMLRHDHFTLSSFFEDFSGAAIVYGTGGRIEANHTMALRLQTTLADQFTEVLTPVLQDAAIDDPERGNLVVIGSAADNSLLISLAVSRGLEIGRDMFRWRGTTYAHPDDGLFLALAHPKNPVQPVYLLVANSALQLYRMTRRYQSLPSWAVFRGDTVTMKGYHAADDCEIVLP
jgi:hypothetical protein